jgi:predicted ATPase/DNA-binding CsgD family transcriptional regulator
MSQLPLSASVAAALLGRPHLLVLDNFEHIVAAAPVVAELVGRCPDLHVLVTSRVVLHVQGEQDYPVPPLGMPASRAGSTSSTPPVEVLAGYDAVALFLERARLVQPDFALTDSNAPAVVDICRRLDGLPLAIELAAARTNVLTPPALQARLTNRLQVLTGGARDQPARHQTLRSAIAWSYDLLNGPEQMLFRRLAVCAGGSTLDAAEAIAGDVGGVDILDGIAVLVDSSLMRRDEPDEEPRFIMLETIREYALEQLVRSGDEETTRALHAAWCLDLAERVAPELTGPDEARWLDRLAAEHDNLHAALRWLLERGEVEPALRIATGIWPYWFFRTHITQGYELLEQALAQDAAVSPVLRADALREAATFANIVGAHERAHQLLDESVALSRSAGYDGGIARALLVRANVIDEEGDEARATQLYAEGVVALRRVGEHPWLGITLTFLGQLLYRKGERERGSALIEEALGVCRECGFVWGIGVALNARGLCLLDRRDYAHAYDDYRESLTLWLSLGDRWRVIRTLTQLGVVAAGGGLAEQAARLLGAGEAQHEQTGLAMMRTTLVGRDAAVAEMRARLGDAAFEAAWDAGRALSVEEAVAEALAVTIPDATSAAIKGRPVSAALAGLTARELEVLRLLVAHQTDRQIAEALYLSPRTVGWHVTHILTKLGVDGRAEAADVARRDRLV